MLKTTCSLNTGGGSRRIELNLTRKLNNSEIAFIVPESAVGIFWRGWGKQLLFLPNYDDLKPQWQALEDICEGAVMAHISWWQPTAVQLDLRFAQ